MIKWFRQGKALAGPALARRTRFLAGEIVVVVPHVSGLDRAHERGRQRAVQVARVYAITVYDATFVDSAELVRGIFLTADQRLVQRLSDLSYVQFPGQAEPR